MEILNYSEFRVTKEMLASKTKRFLNYVIDLVFFYSLFAVIGIIAFLFAELIGNENALVFLDELENVNPLLDRLVTSILFIIFYSIFEILTQKTVGKVITKTIVVLENGEKPLLNTIIKRSLSRYIPFDGISFLGSESRGWHDSISKTYVVDANVFEEHKKAHKEFNLLGKQN